MIFASLVFLTVFLPTTLALYYFGEHRFRNTVLLLASLLFYAWGSGELVLVLIAIGGVAFGGGRLIQSANDDVGSRKRTALIAAVTLACLSPLLWFKYAAFFSEILSDVLGTVGLGFTPLDSRPLPIGISFFTFQGLSYVFDTAVNRAAPVRRFRDFLLYLALFPQLIAGPIVRFNQVREQIINRTESLNMVALGAVRFVHGLSKKVLIADSVALMADIVFNSPESASTLAAWIGVMAYTIQIYFDFSGYSDMAIGLGMMFGFRFPENFKRPYSALSITDFWRRWHITLSEWFRDYVYFPLGGSRVKRSTEYRNLITVFFLTALWHGAAWTFLAWGGFHAALLLIERITGLGATHAERGRVPRRLVLVFLVSISWVFFRATSMSDAVSVLQAMFTWQGVDLGPSMIAAFTMKNSIAFAVGLAAFFLPATWVTGTWLISTDRPTTRTYRLATVGIVMPLSLMVVATGSFSPFLYFQF